MRHLATIVFLLSVLVPGAFAETWVEVGADTEAKYFIDIDSIEFVKNNLRVTKRGIYTRVLTENLGGKPTAFKETRGIIELDCKQRVNRVIRINMVDEHGDVVWTSGDMPRQLWLSVKTNSHAEATLEVTCAHFQQM